MSTTPVTGSNRSSSNPSSSNRRPGTWALLAFVVWSLYVWSTRIKNATGDDTLSSGAKAFSVVLSLTFLAFAVAGVVVLVRAWSRPLAVFGRNPLVAYFLSVGFDSLLTRVTVAGGGSLKGIVYRSTFLPSLRPCCGAEGASLGYAVAYVVLWGLMLGELYRRRIFLRI